MVKQSFAILSCTLPWHCCAKEVGRRPRAHSRHDGVFSLQGTKCTASLLFFTSGALGMRRLDWVLSRIMQRSPRLCFDFVLAFSLRVSWVPEMSHGDPARSPRRYFVAAAEARFVHMTLDRYTLLVNGIGCTPCWRRSRSVLLFLLVLCANRRDRLSACGLRL